MEVKIKKTVISITALLVGVVPGFFIVLNSVFSDGGSLGERLFTFMLVILSYILLGLALGYFSRSKPWFSALWLSAPAIIMLLLYSFNEPQIIVLNLVYILLTVISAWIGSYIGSRVKR